MEWNYDKICNNSVSVFFLSFLNVYPRWLRQKCLWTSTMKSSHKWMKMLKSSTLSENLRCQVHRHNAAKEYEVFVKLVLHDNHLLFTTRSDLKSLAHNKVYFKSEQNNRGCNHVRINYYTSTWKIPIKEKTLYLRPLISCKILKNGENWKKQLIVINQTFRDNWFMNFHGMNGLFIFGVYTRSNPCQLKTFKFIPHGIWKQKCNPNVLII